jgi:DNA end-binding protein Ku
MYPAARPQALSFNQIHKLCNSRVQYDKRCPSCDRSVSSDEILKGYQYAKERYVVMDEVDFTKVTLESTKSISIVQFVEQDEINPLYYYGSHYIVPDGPVTIESFATILKAAKDKKRIALARVAMNGVAMNEKEQVVAIRPRDKAFVMSALYYAAEVRALSGIEELEAEPVVNPEELALTLQLIESITKPFDPEAFENNYRKTRWRWNPRRGDRRLGRRGTAELPARADPRANGDARGGAPQGRQASRRVFGSLIGARAPPPSSLHLYPLGRGSLAKRGR